MNKVQQEIEDLYNDVRMREEIVEVVRDMLRTFSPIYVKANKKTLVKVFAYAPKEGSLVDAYYEHLANAYIQEGHRLNGRKRAWYIRAENSPDTPVKGAPALGEQHIENALRDMNTCRSY